METSPTPGSTTAPAMVRGHDHVEERRAVYAAYAAHPLLATVALPRRLPRESFGPFGRVPTVARSVSGAVRPMHRRHVPLAMIRERSAEETEPEAEA